MGEATICEIEASSTSGVQGNSIQTNAEKVQVGIVWCHTEAPSAFRAAMKTQAKNTPEATASRYASQWLLAATPPKRKDGWEMRTAPVREQINAIK
mmetsp:Transcript_120870/g.258146  ORF Transcript_120870/g.258146 Transcript_120870/m.258146 type:complete len:96 (-) Transcript_120870:467-754(-)